MTAAKCCLVNTLCPPFYRLRRRQSHSRNPLPPIIIPRRQKGDPSFVMTVLSDLVLNASERYIYITRDPHTTALNVEYLIAKYTSY